MLIECVFDLGSLNELEKMDLFDRLENIGYILRPSGLPPIEEMLDIKGNKIIDRPYIICLGGGLPNVSFAYGKDSVYLRGIYDCKDNINLFLAVCALNKNTDKDQWFCNDTGENWRKCERLIVPGRFKQPEKIKKHPLNNFPLWRIGKGKYLHKASIPELEEHFK
jgi:hypothetical protein